MPFDDDRFVGQGLLDFAIGKNHRADFSVISSSLVTHTRREPSDVCGSSTSQYGPSRATGHPTATELVLFWIARGLTAKSCGPSFVSTETNISLGCRPSPSGVTFNRIILHASID